LAGNGSVAECLRHGSELVHDVRGYLQKVDVVGFALSMETVTRDRA
jgi:hypothetical protein